MIIRTGTLALAAILFAAAGGPALSEDGSDFHDITSPLHSQSPFQVLIQSRAWTADSSSSFAPLSGMDDIVTGSVGNAGFDAAPVRGDFEVDGEIKVLRR